MSNEYNKKSKNITSFRNRSIIIDEVRLGMDLR